MSFLEGVLLGFLQGATEFLPVSSSGHLVMGQELLGVNLAGASLEVILHFATLLSVLIAYRVRLWALLTGIIRREHEHLRYAGLLLLASLPLAALGFGLGDHLVRLFDIPLVTAVALLLTGCILWTAKRALAQNPSASLGVGSALTMGLAQAFAVVPGLSRSGATVVAGLWKKVAPREAAAFSFLLSIPSIGGVALLGLPEVVKAEPVASADVLLASATVAAVTGVGAIRLFNRMLASRAFHRFAPYLWLVGATFLWFLLR